MTDNSTANKQWLDPADYGLPYVEVTTLKETVAADKVDEIIPVDISKVKNDTIQNLNQGRVDRVQSPDKKPVTVEKKSSNAWIWIAACFTLALVMVIIWQMNKSSGQVVEDQPLNSEPKTQAVNENQATNVVKSIANEENQLAENQETIVDSTISESSSANSPQTGTTIEQKQPGTLIRVTEKGDRPMFYIIVGSLPNEDMAIREAEQYYNRTDTVYMILPYEGVPHYRLAIERSIGFTAMTEELARAKDQYKEALWILKY